MHMLFKVTHGIPGLLHQEDRSLHLVQDYRKLNVMTVKNAYPLPLIPDILNKISEAKTKYFTKLDIHWVTIMCILKRVTSGKLPSGQTKVSLNPWLCSSA